MELNRDDFLKYLIEYHYNNSNGEMTYMHVVFKYRNEDSGVMYKFEDEGITRYEEWEVDTSISKEDLTKKYKLSDYGNK